MTATLAPVQNWDDVTELFAAAMPGYTERAEQTRLAHTIESAFGGTDWLLAQAGCGCIQGDAEIIVNRGGNGRRMTMRELVIRFNGGRTKGQQRYWDQSIPTYVQREVDGIVRLGRVLNAWFSGVKTTYTVTTNSGRTVRATDEHPFLTERGWLRLDELKIGDEVHVRGEQAAGQPRQAKPAYKRICVLSHPYRNQKTVPEHRLVAEAQLNGMDYPTFLATVRSGVIDGLTFLDPEEFHVHHKDHDPFNNELSNLQIMTPAEHYRLHAEEGRTNSVLYKVVSETVESVELFGEEETYDIEVVDDPHNFIVNGFVVHNTGKSFAGLVPAILWSIKTGETVAVATATKALQSQYANKDLPFLQELFAQAGVPFTWSVLKGRGSYLCKDKLTSDDAADVFNIEALKEELESDEFHSGDLDDLVTEVDPRQKLKLVSTSDECPGKQECPFGDVCFVEKAREKAKKANIVVVNHSLLIADSLVRVRTQGERGLLPEIGAIVVDEIHELESYASSSLGSRITRNGLKFLGRDVAKLLGDARESFSLDRATDALFDGLISRLGRARNLRLRHDDDRVMVPILQTLVAVKDQLGDLAAQLRELDVHGNDKKKIAKKRMLKRVGSMAEKIVEVASADDAALVRWLSKETTRDGEDVVLEYAPLQVGEFLRGNLWNTIPADADGVRVPARKRPVVGMSATLAVGQDFTFLAKVLGMDEGFEGFDAGTPFDFAKQAKVYIPKAKTTKNPRGFADPTRDAFTWRAQAQKVMRDLIEASGGRTLVLFTSRSAMLEAKTALEDYIVDDLGLTLLVQGEGTNRELADRFRTEETSVLFGMNSFMTGLDVQGDALRTVILDKVPFTSPDDVLHAARCEAMDKAVAARKGYTGSLASLPSTVKFHPEAGFNGRSVPEATLVMVQAMGRGVRTATDEALLVVLDPRVNPVGGKNYAKSMVAALPRTQRLEDLSQAKAYLGELAARRDG